MVHLYCQVIMLCYFMCGRMLPSAGSDVYCLVLWLRKYKDGESEIKFKKKKKKKMVKVKCVSDRQALFLYKSMFVLLYLQ